MRKIKFLFPLMFIAAFAASAFTRQTAQHANSFSIPGYYQDAYGYCHSYNVTDPNCSPDILGPVCEEFILSNRGWSIIYEFGTSTICWQPYYSLYPNNP